MGNQLLPFPWIDLVIILALIALNGVLAMTELAIVSSREARLKALARAGNRGAQTALDLAADPGRLPVGGRRSGSRLIGILAGAYSGRQPWRRRWRSASLRSALEPETAQTVGFTLVIVVVTYLSLVIGEIVPKQFALRSPEPIAAFVAAADAVAVAAPRRRSSGCSTGPAR